jgi:predicted small lipoprotein YifL
MIPKSGYRFSEKIMRQRMERFLSRFLPCPCVLFRLALIGALIAVFALAGCGRKGPLDPPPSASLAGDQGAAKSGGAPPAIDSQGRPIAPPGPDKRIPLDALLN